MAERETIPPRPPDVIRFTTDGETHAQAQEKVDNFFRSTLEFIGFKNEELDGVEITIQALTRENGVVSDDFIRLLLAMERPVASALETRTPLNNIQINCATYLNDPNYLQEIRSMLEAHRERVRKFDE